MLRHYFTKFIPFAVWFLFTGAGSAQVNASGRYDAPTEETFIRDALQDAMEHFSVLLNPDYHAYRFSVYEAIFADLNMNSENEYIIAGSLAGQSYYIVMAYYLEEDEWKCQVLNRSVGGGIHDVKVIDLDNDGLMEIYTVVQDREYRRTCKIYRCAVLPEVKLVEMFSFKSGGGFSSSHNFSIFRPRNMDNYSLRIDEVLYPETEDGDVQQTTYIYKIVKREFVLDKVIKGGSSF